MSYCLGCAYHADERPKMADLFCCAGGAGTGYFLAGFCVTGVDKNPQPNYPFKFHQGDALSFLRAHGHEFVAAHASPPCQGQIAITQGNRKRAGWTDDHVNLIPNARAALEATGKPYIIENGPSKHIRPDVKLCGLMFGLPAFRHRSFELGGWGLAQPQHPGPWNHRGLGLLTIGWRHGCKRTVEPSVCPKHDRWCRGSVYGVYGKGGGKPSVEDAQRALGIDWMSDIDDLNEAIPPAYTEYIGWQLLAHLSAEEAA